MSTRVEILNTHINKVDIEAITLKVGSNGQPVDGQPIERQSANIGQRLSVDLEHDEAVLVRPVPA